jgi:hypothetical protein
VHFRADPARLRTDTPGIGLKRCGTITWDRAGAVAEQHSIGQVDPFVAVGPNTIPEGGQAEREEKAGRIVVGCQLRVGLRRFGDGRSDLTSTNAFPQGGREQQEAL